MSRSLPGALLLMFLAIWLAASYGVRYGLMEDGQWVGLCSTPGDHWQCQVRSLLGLGIHFQVLAWAGLALALLAQWVARRAGWWLAVLALFFGIPALVLYTASIAVFVVVLAGLRLVRQPAA
ncbi:hypothetical protein [Pseudomonas vlassakiae]|uniref:Vitamin K epoxide reductase family protein n=1 Tax=Pseudomonas vlassakiae TaxID=485888 RepID=A0A923GGR1_9PSED|nr:hypothetical protein [Pseudomonas vlassakiae]MBV4539569.1 hypothetical protein [Pseudomonas vlassakiae]